MDKNFKILLLIFWFFVFFLIYFHTTDSFNQDLGRHIKFGEIIWQTWEVPKTNLFSYTNPEEPVFNSHWGAQVVFYLIHQVAGVNGLIIMSALINAASLGLIFTLAVKRVEFLIPSILFIPFLYIFLDRTWIRPEMFGNLFFAILLVCLFLPKLRSRLKWFFPIIAFLWINLHISAVLGVFTMGLILLQDSLESIRRIRGNILIGALILIGLLINPYGLNGVLSAFTVLNKYGYTIVENQSLFFLKDFGFPLVWHILIGFLAVFLSFFLTFHIKKKFLAGEIILLLVVGILTLRFVRNEIFFAYLAFIVSCLNFGLPVRQAGQLKGIVRGGWASLLLGLISIVLIRESHELHGLPIGFGNQESYKKGVDFLAKNDLKGPIFNNFDIGGYLIYRLYPGQKVFVDNRPEAYPVDFFQKIYIPTQQNPKKFEEIINQYRIQTIIWGHNDITPWSRSFMERISTDPEWREIYQDEVLAIYTKFRY